VAVADRLGCKACDHVRARLTRLSLMNEANMVSRDIRDTASSTTSLFWTATKLARGSPSVCK